jgi:hypothetical protein
MRKALKQARLETAARLHADAKPLSCDARFAGLGTDLKTQRDQYEALIAKGDSALASNSPQQAIDAFLEAGRANVESPDIGTKLREARSAQLRLAAQNQEEQRRAKQSARAQRTGGSKGGKVLAWILIIGIIGGAAAYGATHKKQGQ